VAPTTRRVAIGAVPFTIWQPAMPTLAVLDLGIVGLLDLVLEAARKWTWHSGWWWPRVFFSAPSGRGSATRKTFTFQSGAATGSIWDTRRSSYIMRNAVIILVGAVVAVTSVTQAD
jgi:hypothetical protein